MSQYMHTGGFKWVEFTLNGLEDLDVTLPIGQIYKVDISYPVGMHDGHCDQPFQSENSVSVGSKMCKLATLERKKLYNSLYKFKTDDCTWTCR